MEALWTHGAASVREIQEHLPEKDRSAYTTVQTMVYRLEAKKAVRRVKKVGNAHVFEAVVHRETSEMPVYALMLAISASARDSINPNEPSITTAVQEQLGLKLESTRAPVDVLVIDRLERPVPD